MNTHAVTSVNCAAASMDRPRSRRGRECAWRDLGRGRQVLVIPAGRCRQKLIDPLTPGSSQPESLDARSDRVRKTVKEAPGRRPARRPGGKSQGNGEAELATRSIVLGAP